MDPSNRNLSYPGRLCTCRYRRKVLSAHVGHAPSYLVPLGDAGETLRSLDRDRLPGTCRYPWHVTAARPDAADSTSTRRACLPMHNPRGVTTLKLDEICERTVSIQALITLQLLSLGIQRPFIRLARCSTMSSSSKGDYLHTRLILSHKVQARDFFE